MLQITIEIWPGGDKTRARVLATSSVANLSDLADVSDYAVRVSEGYNHIPNSAPYSLCGKIFQHDRKSSVWALVAKIATLATEEAAKAGR